MIVQSYLFFEGRCEEALQFYKKAIGAEVTAMMRNSDSPDQSNTPPGMENKVLHCNFSVGETQLMASDGMCSGTPKFAGVSLSISVTEASKAERLFAALSEGGQVQLPMHETFFAERFGMVADKFGVSWMVIAGKNE
jgi:PhnB protein